MRKFFILCLLAISFSVSAQIGAVMAVSNGHTEEEEENIFAARVMGISGGTFSADVTNTRWIRYMQPIVNPTKDAGALDSSQSWLLDIVDTGDEWRLLYTGANTQTINYFGQDYTNNDATYMAIKTKSNDVLTGWNKVLDVNGDPMPLFKPSFVNNQFDEWQVWIRTVIVDGSTWKAWFIGDSGFAGAFDAFTYRVGYATSTDEGMTWSKLGTTPIYTDLLTGGGRGIVTLRVVYNPDTEKYVMFYGGIDMNVAGFFVAQSDDGITGWVKTHSNLFANLDYLAPSDFTYVDGTYYLWVQANQMMPAGNLGPARDVIVFSSTDLTTWTNLGTQLTIRGAQEFGIGNHTKVITKPNGNKAIAHTWYINRTQALDALNATKEPSPATKIADSNDDSIIKNSQCSFLYPDYVKFHAPLSYEQQFTDVVNLTSGAINSPAVWFSERDFIKLSGSQTVTMPNDGTIINGGDFQLKMRVQTVTTGTHTLLKIGNDIWWTLENGKQRIRVSSDGVTYQKDYIATVNIGKPSGLDYIDDHVYIAVSCVGGVIRMWNEDCVTEITGSMTETVDNPLTTVNNSGADILIGENATLELRSVSILDGATATELTELDI
jgi:hypothetical protein